MPPAEVAPWPATEPPPSPAVLLGVTLWRLGLAGLALYFAQTGKEETMSSESLSYLSNVGVAVGFFLLAAYPAAVGGRRHEPRTAWLRGALTVMMLLVGLVFTIGMGEEPDGPHAVIPALVLTDWLLVGRNQFRTRWWEPFTWIVFPLLYLVYHQSNDIPLYDDILGEDKIATMVPTLLVGCIVLGYLLYGGALVRRVATGGAGGGPGAPDPRGAPRRPGPPGPPGPANRSSPAVLIVAGLLVFGIGGAYLLTSGDGDSGEEPTGPPSTTAAGTGDEGELPPEVDGDADSGSAMVPAGSSPEAVVESYIAAGGTADCETMVALVTENMLDGTTRQAALAECQATARGEPETVQVYASLEVNGVEEEGDVATVDCLGEVDGSPLVMIFTVVRQGDTWRIDNLS